MNKLFLALAICLVAACRVAPSATEALNLQMKGQQAGPDAEKAVKALSAAWPARDGIPTIAARPLPLPFTGGQRLKATNVVISSNDLVVVDNRRGTLFRMARLGAAGFAPTAEPYRVSYPMNARAVSEGIYVQDDNGLALYGLGGAIAKQMQLFTTMHDFLPLPDRSLLFNAASTRDPRTVLLTLDANGHPRATWEEPHPLASELGGLLSSAAFLARCGDRIGVAMKHSPHFYVVTPNLETVADVTLDFPNRDALDGLANRPELVRPNPSFLWQPGYVAGVECIDDRFFVLLDLPVVRLYELSPAGEIVALYRNDTVAFGTGLRRLAGASDVDAHRLYSIVEDSDRDIILEISIARRQERALQTANGGHE